MPLERAKREVALSGERLGYSWSEKRNRTFPEQTENKRDLLITMSSRRHNENDFGNDKRWEIETKKAMGLESGKDKGNTEEQGITKGTKSLKTYTVRTGLLPESNSPSIIKMDPRCILSIK